LALHSVTKSFGTQRVLTGVQCEFPAGQISTVLGISGSGKTTLLRLIAGLEAPDQGDVFLANERITHRLPQERNIGFVFQDLALYSHLTVERNIVLPLLAHGCAGREARARAVRIAEEFGLAGFLARRAGSLSGGEAQRLALARSLVREPAVTLLDEPFSHLDAPLQREARRFVFSTLRARGATAVLVTHNHQDAQEAGGKVAFLERGRIVQEGAWADLYQHPATPLVARVVSFLEPIELRGIIGSEAGRLVLNCLDLDLRIGLDGRVNGTVPPAAQRALVFARPEDLPAQPQDKAAPGGDQSSWLKGTIVESFMAGPVLFYRLQHASGFLFAGRAEDPLQPVGSELFVDLGSAPKVVFPEAIKEGSDAK
jgi:ABC-type sugar transport system ATPase subunit